MALYTLILKDKRKKVFQRLNFINEDRNRHFAKNIESMADAGILIEKDEIDFKEGTKNLENAGWTEDEGLYDKLLMEYCAITGKHLTGWVI